MAETPQNPAPTPTRAVLLMAYGGPESLDDVEPFLLDIRGGRPTPPELVEEIRQRYAAIGGRSPLLEISRAQAAGLEELLNEGPGDGEPRFRAFVGMRHWAPYIREAVAEIAEAGIREVVALCLAPHYSRMSIGAYLAKLHEAVAEQERQGRPLRVTAVESWGEHPLFLDAVARRVREALQRWPTEERNEVERREVEILFTAHSLPTRIVEQGDPYADQLLATARGVAARLTQGESGPEPRWSFCYQSAGASSIPWLGPAIEEVIPERAAAGRKHLLVAPIGFVADHVEILFDLDVEAKQIADEHGVRLERTESMNDDPDFLAALAAVVREHLDAEPGELVATAPREAAHV